MSSKKSSTLAEPVVESDSATIKTTGAVVEESAGGSPVMTPSPLPRAQAAPEKGQQAGLRDYGNLVDLQKANLEAAVKAGTIMANGYEAIGKELAGFAQLALEANLNAAQAILGAETLREVVDLQRDHLRKTLEQALAESGKLGEMSVKLAGEAITPLQARMATAVEQFVKPMAA